MAAAQHDSNVALGASPPFDRKSNVQINCYSVFVIYATATTPPPARTARSPAMSPLPARGAPASTSSPPLAHPCHLVFPDTLCKTLTPFWESFMDIARTVIFLCFGQKPPPPSLPLPGESPTQFTLTRAPSHLLPPLQASELKSTSPGRRPHDGPPAPP